MIQGHLRATLCCTFLCIQFCPHIAMSRSTGPMTKAEVARDILYDLTQGTPTRECRWVKLTPTSPTEYTGIAGFNDGTSVELQAKVEGRTVRFTMAQTTDCAATELVGSNLMMLLVEPHAGFNAAYTVDPSPGTSDVLGFALAILVLLGIGLFLAAHPRLALALLALDLFISWKQRHDMRDGRI
jgi:hypothetical protein